MTDVQARYHGGDAGGDPPQRPTHLPSQCEGSVPAQKKRGPNRSLTLHEKIGRGGGRPVPIQFDVTGTWHAVGENASHLPRDIGSMIRAHVPPYYSSWRKVPQQLRDRVVQEVCSHFDFQGLSKAERVQALSGLMRTAADLYRDWKYRLNRHFLQHGGDRDAEYDLDRARRCVPRSISPQTWHRCVQFFDSDQYRELSGRNANNRAQKVVNDRHGSKSIAAHRYDKRNKETGELQSVPDNFRDRHTYRSGEWIHPLPEEQFTRMTELVAQQAQSSVSSTSSPGTPVPINEAAIADEVLGTRRGHRRAVGRVLAGHSTRSAGTSGAAGSSQYVSQMGELQDQLQLSRLQLEQSREQLQQSQRLIQDQQQQLVQQQQQFGTYFTQLTSMLRQQGLDLPQPPFVATPPGPTRFRTPPVDVPPGPSQVAGTSRHQDDDADDSDDETATYFHIPSP